MLTNKSKYCIYNDSAETLYSLLESSIETNSDYRNTYAILDNIYSRVINQNTSFVTIKLVGRFAKTDYLLKEFNASIELTHSINDFRTRVKEINRFSNDELKEFFRYDIKALAQFIHIIYNAPIPEKLTTIFPYDVLHKKRNNFFADYIRVIVNDWDDKYIYCVSEDYGDELKILYAKECGIYK